jgi:hypothetical protein
MHDGRRNTYQLKKDGKQYRLLPLKDEEVNREMLSPVLTCLKIDVVQKEEVVATKPLKMKKIGDCGSHKIVLDLMICL